MRNDPEFAVTNALEPDLQGAVSRFGALDGQRMREGGSLSGHERNHLFLNLDGRDFAEVSAISGLDHPADGRATAALDFDRDGWLDFAVVNANAPQLQLFRNRIGELPREATTPGGRVIAVRLVGANVTAASNPLASNRNGFGAIVEAHVGGAKLLRESRSSDGFAAQSSATLLFGIGTADRVDGLRVRWPSGAERDYGAIPAGSLVTLYENPVHSPDGSGLSLASWLRSIPLPDAPRETRRLALAAALPGPDTPALRIFTTMASWCDVCKGELPQVAKLRAAFQADALELVGVPVDEDDDAAVLDAYRREQHPAYVLLAPLSPDDRARVQSIVEADLKVDALPASIVTDRAGRILRTLARLPSVSEIRRWLAELPS